MDGGLTWSNPIKVNASPSGVAAFTPSVDVASDGTVAVTYYDFRNNTPNTSTLPTDAFRGLLARRREYLRGRAAPNDAVVRPRPRAAGGRALPRRLRGPLARGYDFRPVLHTDCLEHEPGGHLRLVP